MFIKINNSEINEITLRKTKKKKKKKKKKKERKKERKRNLYHLPVWENRWRFVGINLFGEWGSIQMAVMSD